MQKQLIIASEAAMLELGAKIAQAIAQTRIDNLILYLQGNLGVGKTTLTRGVLRGFGYTQKVKSPTYALVEPYHLSAVNIFHFDLYRLENPRDVAELGLLEYFADGISLVEWPEKLKSQLPTADLDCQIEMMDGHRQINFFSNTPKGEAILELME